MRHEITLVAALIAAAPLAAKPLIQHWPLYQSLEDPPGQQPRRILVNDNVFGYGQAGDSRESLMRSDLGFPLYFVRVKGGVRVQGQPLVFPDGSRRHFDFDDYSCSIMGSAPSVDVVCRSKLNGQLYHSRLLSGGLVAFDIRCFDVIGRSCHFYLVAGDALRPSKIRQN
jgi:hypothetical protein